VPTTVVALAEGAGVGGAVGVFEDGAALDGVLGAALVGDGVGSAVGELLPPQAATTLSAPTATKAPVKRRRCEEWAAADSRWRTMAPFCPSALPSLVIHSLALSR
jgi:hypothetical protein